MFQLVLREDPTNDNRDAGAAEAAVIDGSDDSDVQDEGPGSEGDEGGSDQAEEEEDEGDDDEDEGEDDEVGEDD